MIDSIYRFNALKLTKKIKNNLSFSLIAFFFSKVEFIDHIS